MVTLLIFLPLVSLGIYVLYLDSKQISKNYDKMLKDFDKFKRGND